MENEMRVIELVGDICGSLVSDNMSKRLNNGERFGQAFYNALPSNVQIFLSGTPADPFHKDDAYSVFAALDYLTR